MRVRVHLPDRRVAATRRWSVARARAKEKIELQAPSEAREHRLKLGEMSDSQVVQASLDGDPRALGQA